jgi:hypothetical protein
MAESSVPIPEKSQYHHYIPRFILRNYAHPASPPKNTSKSKKRGKRKSTPRAPPLMLSSIDLSGETAQIKESTVDKTFGITDMYRDFSRSTKQHAIEEQLSVLESRAGEVISGIRKAFEAGRPTADIKRPQRDILRKFLFIMKYRGRRFHKRYFHQTAEEYNENDRERMLEYMARKGFTKPIDVWFDNIKGILECEMDYEMKWMEKIQERIYPNDAKWFINHMQQFYMALCTPSVEGEEFLLSQNAYSIHEGASSDKLDPKTGKIIPGPYSEFHILAPVAPKLIIVLRTFLLPVPEEDSNLNMKAMREVWYEANVSQHVRPESVGLALRDLPIMKARNSYTKIVDGSYVAVNGGPKGASDVFYFPFCAIDTRFVDRINGIMLNESHQIDGIVFANKVAACKTIKNYVEHCVDFGVDMERLENVWKLEQAVKLLDPKSSDQTTSGQSEFDPIYVESVIGSSDKVFDLFKESEKAAELYFQICKSANLALTISNKSKPASQHSTVKTSLKLEVYSTHASNSTLTPAVSLPPKERKREINSLKCTTASHSKSCGSISNGFGS